MSNDKPSEQTKRDNDDNNIGSQHEFYDVQSTFKGSNPISSESRHTPKRKGKEPVPESEVRKKFYDKFKPGGTLGIKAIEHPSARGDKVPRSIDLMRNDSLHTIKETMGSDTSSLSDVEMRELLSEDQLQDLYQKIYPQIKQLFDTIPLRKSDFDIHTIKDGLVALVSQSENIQETAFIIGVARKLAIGCPNHIEIEGFVDEIESSVRLQIAHSISSRLHAAAEAVMYYPNQLEAIGHTSIAAKHQRERRHAVDTFVKHSGEKVQDVIGNPRQQLAQIQDLMASEVPDLLALKKAIDKLPSSKFARVAQNVALNTVSVASGVVSKEGSERLQVEALTKGERQIIQALKNWSSKVDISTERAQATIEPLCQEIDQLEKIQEAREGKSFGSAVSRVIKGEVSLMKGGSQAAAAMAHPLRKTFGAHQEKGHVSAYTSVALKGLSKVAGGLIVQLPSALAGQVLKLTASTTRVATQQPIKVIEKLALVSYNIVQYKACIDQAKAADARGDREAEARAMIAAENILDSLKWNVKEGLKASAATATTAGGIAATAATAGVPILPYLAHHHIAGLIASDYLLKTGDAAHNTDLVGTAIEQVTSFLDEQAEMNSTVAAGEKIGTPPVAHGTITDSQLTTEALAAHNQSWKELKSAAALLRGGDESEKPSVGVKNTR